MAFKPPTPFNFHEPAEWSAWRSRFGHFRLASKLSKEDQEVHVQVIALLYSMGPEAERIYSTFELAEGDRTFDTVLSKFDEHFIPQRNIIHLRAQFHRREQQSKETIEEYIRALYELSEHANFPNKEDCIRDRLVLGVRDKELSEKLQLKADMSLKEAVRNCQTRIKWTERSGSTC